MINKTKNKQTNKQTKTNKTKTKQNKNKQTNKQQHKKKQNKTKQRLVKVHVNTLIENKSHDSRIKLNCSGHYKKCKVISNIHHGAPGPPAVECELLICFCYFVPDLIFHEQLGVCFYKSRGCLPYQCTRSMLIVFSGFELFICYCYFVCMNLVTLCSLLCVPVCHVFVSGLHSFHYRYNLDSFDYS